MQEIMGMEFHPLTKNRWNDFETLFGTGGACGGCWCMWFRLRRPGFEANKGEGNRLAMKALVEAGKIPGLLAYDRGRPAGWVAVAPREEYPRLAGSKIARPVDDRPVWAVVCLYVAKSHRRKGVSAGLLRAAIAHAARQGGSIVEGYAVEPEKVSMPDVFAFPGLAGAYRQAGFVEVARPSARRPVMRYFIGARDEISRPDASTAADGPDHR